MTDLCTRNAVFLLFFCLTSITIIHAQSAKFGKGISFTAQDSTLFLQSNFRFQSLYTASRALSSDGDWDQSLSIRRARLKFQGWAMDPNLQFKVELALSNQDLKSKNDYEQTERAPKMILDAVLKWKFHKNFSIWAGQAKLPGNRQRVVSSQKLQLVDRSLVNSIFNLDREMGLQLHGKLNHHQSILKPILAISMGEGRNVTKNIGGLNYTARLEFLPFGEFSSKGDYFEADLQFESTPKLAFGATYNMNYGASRQKQSGAFLLDNEGRYLSGDLQTLLFDVVFKYAGLSITGEFAEKHCILDKNVNHEDVRDIMLDANGESFYTGKGFNIQLGYLMSSNWEVAGRYTTVTPDWDTSFARTREYTLGLSKYISGHNLKIQSDISLRERENSATNSLRYRLQFEFGF